LKLQVDVNVRDRDDALEALQDVLDEIEAGNDNGSVDGGRFELLVPVEPLAH
jgi:hypothetical protein